MCKGGNLFLQRIILFMESIYKILLTVRIVLELKVAEIAISLSINQYTIKDIKLYVREITAYFANFFKVSDLADITV